MADEDSELSELRKQKAQKVEERKNAEEQLKMTLRVILEDSAYQRLMNVKLANSQLFIAASQHILGIFKQVGRKLKDSEVLMILTKIKESEKKETKITFTRK